MKIWVPKQREVKVTVRDDNEPATHHLEPGELEVTDEDGKSRVYDPDTFAKRFEQIEKNSWPGYLKRKAGQEFMNGTLAVGFEGATLTELIGALNAWAEKPENRGWILGDNGDRYWQGTDGRFYAVMYCYAQTNEESHAHLAERSEIEREVKEEVERRWEERKKQAGIDERDALTKAQDAKKAKDAIERVRQRELLEKERIADHCKANHGKAMKGKKS